MPTTKKAARKAAKKTADHHHDKQANHLRRAYEHMGRVDVLRQTAKPSATDPIAELTRWAQRAITDGNSKDAADLLRASEHLSFAVLAGEVTGAVRVSAELKESITEQFNELARRAEEHWEEEEEHSDILAQIYESCRDRASKSFKSRAYHQALEFARAAEALAQVRQQGPLTLESGHKRLPRKSA